MLKKYPHAQGTLDFLAKNSFRPPLFGIDATQLETYDLGKFDLIFFTFPHLGIPNNDPRNIPTHQHLVKSFVKSAAQCLKPGGQVHITLKTGEPYDSWDVANVLETGTDLELSSHQALDKSLFPGYHHRLTNEMGGTLQEVPDKNAQVHIFEQRAHDNDNDNVLPFNVILSQFSEPPAGCEDEAAFASQILQILKQQESNGPLDVLEIRREFAKVNGNRPDTRQFNRVLYGLEKEAKVLKCPPRVGRSKPLWMLKA